MFLYNTSMDQYIKDNKVAVLTNPRQGWWTVHHTWNLVFDPVIVADTLGGNRPDMTVDWVTPGTLISIDWHDQYGEVVTILQRGHSPTTGSELDLDKSWYKV